MVGLLVWVDGSWGVTREYVCDVVIYGAGNLYPHV